MALMARVIKQTEKQLLLLNQSYKGKITLQVFYGLGGYAHIHTYTRAVKVISKNQALAGRTGLKLNVDSQFKKNENPGGLVNF